MCKENACQPTSRMSLKNYATLLYLIISFPIIFTIKRLICSNILLFAMHSKMEFVSPSGFHFIFTCAHHTEAYKSWSYFSFIDLQVEFQAQNLYQGVCIAFSFFNVLDGNDLWIHYIAWASIRWKENTCEKQTYSKTLNWIIFVFVSNENLLCLQRNRNSYI